MKRPHLHLISLLTVLCACGGGGSSGPSSLSGDVVLLVDVVSLPENEPNGSFDAAQPVGALHAQRPLAIDGRFDSASDIDAYAFVAREPLHVEIDVRPIRGGGLRDGEFAIAAFDAVEQTLRAEGDALDGRARIAFDVQGSFDVALRPLGAGGAYRIFVRAEPIVAAASMPLASSLVERGVEPSFGSELEMGGTSAWDAYWTPSLESRTGEYLLLASPGRDPAVVAAAHGATLVSRIPSGAALVRPHAFAAQGSAGPGVLASEVRATVASLRRTAESPDVEWTELNRVRRVSAPPPRAASAPRAALPSAPSTVLGGPPNDTYYGLQWHYDLMRLPQAWQTSTGDNALLFAVIDTGETAHPDLDARQVAGYDFILDPASAKDGNGLDADPTDEGDGTGLAPSSFHGTHVAGTIGAETNNAQGVAGVTWSGRIMHVRALGAAGGTDFDIANALLYSARLANNSGTLPAERADVVNMSFGGPGTSATLSSAVTQARNAGCVLVAASGNENTQTKSYPAAYSGVISIGAVDANGTRAPYSNYGNWLDLVAPGGDLTADLDGDAYPDGVLSTLMDDSGPGLAPVYAFYQGTSMACPHAAGLAGLVLAVDPLLTPAQVESILVSTATDLGAAGKDNFYGHGLVNAEFALQMASGGGGGAPVLALTPGTLAFGAATTALSSAVSNTGGGVLDVTGVATSTVDGAPWLSASIVGPGSASADASSILVTVDRTGLADGAYSGSVSVTSNGGGVVLSISMEVEDVPVLPAVDVYVLLVDAQTYETVAQDIVNSVEEASLSAQHLVAVDLPFLLAELPQGEYLIFAGSDDDNDGFILGTGDAYAGAYPTLNEIEAVAVGKGKSLAGYDFVVSGSFAPTGGSGLAGGGDPAAHTLNGGRGLKLFAPNK
jgi:subtilisin family serine protease